MSCQADMSQSMSCTLQNMDSRCQWEFQTVKNEISFFLRSQVKISVCMVLQLWLSRATPSTPIRTPRATRTLSFAMAALLNRVKKLGSREPDALALMEEPRDVAPPTHHPRRALRGWRVMMDKIVTLLMFSSLQRVVEEWFPQSQPWLATSSEASKDKEETIEDVYAEIIRDAKMLPPLRGKEPPKTSTSTCVHPKMRLKGGATLRSPTSCAETAMDGGRIPQPLKLYANASRRTS